MYLLIDECCGKALVRVAHELGHTAQRTTSIAALGQRAKDHEIFDFARRHEAVVVTNNYADFLDLARRSDGHAGVILVPNVRGKPLAALFERVLPVAEAIFEQDENMVVSIDEHGMIGSFPLP